MLTRREALLGSVLTAAAAATMVAMPAVASAKEVAGLPREKITLVAPPFVHAHDQVAKDGPKVVEFTMTIEEKSVVIDADGTQLNAMTYNGSIPGPLMVVHEGDYLELTLINPDTNTLAHNIDFHAATGALGGGGLTLINPGEQVTLRFKATRTGTFVYHCAPGGPMIPWHVVSGMSGAVMVLPRDGLRDDKGKSILYDRIYYIGENDFYVPRDEQGKFKKYETAGDNFDDTMKVMRGLIPTHVVFNGKAGSLTGDIILEDVRVPASALLGGVEGNGFKTAMRALDTGRLSVGGAAIGYSRRILESAMRYAMERKAFGQAISNFQLIQAMLADSKAELYAAECMIADTIRRSEKGLPFSTEASCVKMFATEACGRIADRAVQIYGGAGYMAEYEVERFYRDVRLYRIYEGTTQIQQLVIAKNMLRDFANGTWDTGAQAIQA